MSFPFTRVFDRLFAVMGALLLMQLPFFIQQYQHQLIGHVAELHWQMEHMQKGATSSGKTLDSYIKKFIAHEDPDIANQGEVMSETQKRLKRFSTATLRLQMATTLTRPFHFLLTLQSEVVKSTMRNFKPGIAFTFESLIYAFVGIFFGASLFYFLRKLFSFAYAS